MRWLHESLYSPRLQLPQLHPGLCAAAWVAICFCASSFAAVSSVQDQTRLVERMEEMAVCQCTKRQQGKRWFQRWGVILLPPIF